MEKKNRYKNRIGRIMMIRLFLAGGLFLSAGVGFVLIRNAHVITGNEIVAVENEVLQLDQEIELWELRIAAVRDRQELSRRLRWAKSDLTDIDLARVIEIPANGRMEVPVASAY
jgi:hypothetical protein